RGPIGDCGSAPSRGGTRRRTPRRRSSRRAAGSRGRADRATLAVLRASGDSGVRGRCWQRRIRDCSKLDTGNSPKPMDTGFSDRFWESPDGLKLHFRAYPGREDRLPVVCMHGLTRNARDFAGLAAHLAGERRVLVPEMRGRGDSEYARDPATYTPLTYVEDV